MATVAERTGEQGERVQLELSGMTCASCAARIERKLNKLDGVEATVNFATERATAHCDPDVSVEQLVAAVESAGYGAHPSITAHETRDGKTESGHHHHDEPLAVLKRRLVLALAWTATLTIGVYFVLRRRLGVKERVPAVVPSGGIERGWSR